MVQADPEKRTVKGLLLHRAVLVGLAPGAREPPQRTWEKRGERGIQRRKAPRHQQQQQTHLSSLPSTASSDGWDGCKDPAPHKRKCYYSFFPLSGVHVENLHPGEKLTQT